MLDTAVLNQLIFDAFTGKITWLHASTLHSVDEYIDAFYRTRMALQQRVLDGLTDAQASLYYEKMATWSISETITHLVYSQNFYYNALLDVTSSHLPHILEAARGFGEGAQRGVAASTLRDTLQSATVTITTAIEQTRKTYDPKQIVRNRLFGEANYPTWILLMLAHETDHLRQAIPMRRLAQVAVNPTPADSPAIPPIPPVSPVAPISPTQDGASLLG